MAGWNDRSIRALAAGAAALIASSAATAGSLPKYEIKTYSAGLCGDLGPNSSQGRAINNHSLVAGYVSFCASDYQDALSWCPGDKEATYLQFPPGTIDSTAYGLNDHNDVVGVFNGPLNPDRAFLIADGQFFDLGTMPQGNISEAYDVNNDRLVVGMWTNNLTGPLHGFVYQDGIMTDLGPLLGTSSSTATCVNDAGQVGGWMGWASWFDARGFILQDGELTVLPPIPGGSTSVIKAISEAGDATGHGVMIDPETKTTVTRAFAYLDGRMIVLDLPPGYSKSRAYGINSSRQVVGTMGNDMGNDLFLWQDGVMFNLEDLVPPGSIHHMDMVWAINDRGEITGGAVVPYLGTCVFCMTPVQVKPGDLDADGIVNGFDLANLLGAWGPCGANCVCAPDLNLDGMVNGFDAAILLGNWG